MSDNIVKADTFDKALTQTEALEKKIIIPKQALKFFPKPWKDFTLKSGKTKYTTRIESVSCNCMGPQKKHDHYWLQDEKTKELLDWRAGMHIKFSKVKENEYMLESI